MWSIVYEGISDAGRVLADRAHARARRADSASRLRHHASAITLTALALQTFTTVGALAPAAASIGGHHCGSLDCIWLRSP